MGSLEIQNYNGAMFTSTKVLSDGKMCMCVWLGKHGVISLRKHFVSLSDNHIIGASLSQPHAHLHQLEPLCAVSTLVTTCLCLAEPFRVCLNCMVHVNSIAENTGTTSTLAIHVYC